MNLVDILIFTTLAIVLRVILPSRLHVWWIFLLSGAAVYWFQPSTSIRYLDFWLPTGTLLLAVIGWIVTTPVEHRKNPESIRAGVFLLALVILIGFTRSWNISDALGIPRPPQTKQIVLVLIGILVILFSLIRWVRSTPSWIWAAGVVLLAVFIALKTPAITEQLSFQIRRVGDQAVGLASHTDLRWLGFSYLAFRMLHTFRDRQSGRLPVSNLREYISYALFFPALTAGPIDRIEHFLDEIGTKGRILPEDFIHGLRRLTIGLFKKFVVADTIGLIALSPALAEAVTSTGWIWITVYAFAVQIYLDFSGYTDIAIGMGLIAGIRLPENFNKPYLRPNLTLFWANWHITLTQWFRSYFFNPLTRRLRRSKVGYSTGAIILTTQVLTMLLIGLWHGVTWNFAIWGLWHGFGLFVQNRYSEWARLNGIHFGQGTLSKKLATAGSTLLTFHYVALGWVWFALPDTAEAWNVFLILFGIR